MAKLLSRKGLTVTSSPLESYDAGNQKIINLLDPTNPQDAATKAWVEAQSASSALDGSFRISNTADETKKIAFDASGITASTVRTITMADADVDLADIATNASNISSNTDAIALKADDNAVIKKDGSVAFTGNQAMGSNRITGLADGVASQDAATVAQVQAAQAGIVGKAAVVAASTANIDLATGGLLTIDGIALSADDRVLVKDQTDPIENGIYLAKSGAWVRSEDFNGDPQGEVSGGNTTFVNSGTVSANSVYIVTGSGAITVDTDAINWTIYSRVENIVAGNGIQRSGTTIAIDFTEFDTDNITEGSVNLYYTAARFDSAFSAKSTSDLSEGTNLYYTQARFDAALTASDTDDLSEGAINKYYSSTLFDSDFSGKSTTDLSEGTNLYYTAARFHSAFTAKSTDDLTEGGTNKYYSSTLFNSDFSAKDSDDLAEGATNLYFTEARAKAAAVNDTAYNDVSWDGVTDVAPSKNAVRDKIVSIDSDISALQGTEGKAFSAGVAGESFAVNGLYFVRRAKSGETAGRFYKATADSFDNSRVVGFVVVAGTAITAGDAIAVYKLGEAALGSADTAFSSGDENKVVYLDQSTAGKWTIAPTSASGDILKEIGVVGTTGIIDFMSGIMAIEA